MSEPVFEAGFTLTKTQFYEATRLVYMDKNGRLLRWLFAGLGVLWLGLAGFAAANGGIVSALIELAALVLAFLWTFFFIPNGRAKRAWEKIYDAERTVAFHADRLTLTSEERELSIELSDVKKRLYSKNIAVFITNDNTGVILPRELADEYSRRTNEND